jgi:hypothetical protein
MSFEFNNEAVADYYPMVHQVSTEYSKKYRMVNKEDIKQELWIWFATHQRKMGEWMNLEPKDREKLVAKSLRNAAHDFCLKEKASIQGYNPEDVFFYKKEFIKLLLPAVINSDWARIENTLSLGGRSPKSLSEANDWMAYSADIKSALSKLDDKERKLIVEFYGHDMDGTTLHEQILPEKSTARAAMMQANRALNKMVRHLGGFAPYNDPKDPTEEEVQNVSVEEEVEAEN